MANDEDELTNQFEEELAPSMAPDDNEPWGDADQKKNAVQLESDIAANPYAQEAAAPVEPTVSQKVADYIRAKKTSGQMNPQNAPSNIIPGMLSKYGYTNPELNDAALKQAQQQTRERQLTAGIGNAFNTLASVPNGLAPDTQFFKDLDANANSGVKDIEERRALQQQNLTQDSNVLKMVDSQLQTQNTQQSMDPNSNSARATRAVIAKYHPELASLPGFDQMSALDLKTNIIPLMESEAKINYAKAKVANGNDFKVEALRSKILKEANPISASSRTMLGIAQNSKTAADRALNLLNRPTVTKQDAASIAQDVNRLVSQTSTVSGADHQNYDTAYSRIQGALQAASGSPTDALPNDIKNHLKSVVKDMYDISNGVIEQNTNAVIAGHDPKYAPMIRNIVNVRTQQLGQEVPGSNVPANSGKTISQSDLNDWAQKHKKSIGEAQDLLGRAGYTIGQ